jgi:Carboxypeptidase regulatory-like domain
MRLIVKKSGSIALVFVCLLLGSLPLAAQTAALVGTVKDAQQGVVPDATVTLTNLQNGATQSLKSDAEGGYEFARVRPGTYSLKVEHMGFKTYLQTPLALEVEQRARIDASLEVGDTATQVNVEATVSGIQTESTSLGSVVTATKIAEIPLNGRFFLDLALLQAGTVAPSTNNRTFLAVPSGIGISGINASGTREDSTNYLFDGINVSDMAQNQITFQPNLDMIQEFKVQTNAFSAEYGRNAGIIINGVSKSGSNGFHGTAYEFVRNEKFDAKNFFDPAALPIAPFKRNIYGYSVGGPIIKNKTFFFTSYEGRQGREVATLNTPVLTPAQRATITNPTVLKLLALVPLANDPSGTKFQGSGSRQRKLNQFTGRFDHNISQRDFLFGTFISNRDERTEPTLQGNNLPGFGDARPAKRYFLSVGETHIFSPSVTNEFHTGLNRVNIAFNQLFLSTPADFGITSPSAVFPQITVSGNFIFGGINGFPQGRGDTTFSYSDTLAWIKGKHSLKFGAEIRRFYNNNLAGGTGGTITFGTVAAFLAGTPTGATETALPATPAMTVGAVGIFAQDDVKLTPTLTMNIGLRWEYNGVPEERHNRLSVFDFNTYKLVQVGNGVKPYNETYTNFGPRVGFAWDPTGKAKTVVRTGFGLYYDQPVTNIVSPLDNNPPYSSAVSNTSNISLTNPFAVPPGVGSALQAIDPNFTSGRVMSYNFNVQQEVLGAVVQVAYVGSQGRHLRIVGDYNQGINGVRPLPFSTITIQESAASSNYNGLWITADKRLAKGLTFNTSYTFSKSIDTNSVGSSNPQAQDFRNFQAERALSDFDARHRFIFSGIYQFQFKATNPFMKRIVEGWQLSPQFTAQTGNPFSPIIPTTDTKFSLEAFDRPNLVPGQPLYLDNGGPSGFINPKAFTTAANAGFGNAGRNILTAPGMMNLDLQAAKSTAITEHINLQFRAEVFNIMNHPNFGQPVQQVTAATFGQILATRATRGDLSSSRQIQLGMKLVF